MSYLERINIETPEYEEVTIEKDYCKLLIKEDKKPRLFLITNLTNVEYYAMFAMNLFSTTIHNMV